MGTFIDMTGWKMSEHGVVGSRLTVTSRAPNQGRKVCWNCICQCGNTVIVRGDQLRSGIAKSCGCLQKEIAKEKCAQTGKNNLGTVSSHRKDLIGKTFGSLTVESYHTTKDGKRAFWWCRCECGALVSVSSTHLLTGHTKGCGCTFSFGNKKIRQLLDDNNVSYAREYTFSDLRDKNSLRFDFAIFKDNKLWCLCEYQGIQHYNDDIGSWNSPKEHDSLKREYCKQHNIKLVEIPYWDYDKIDFEYLREKLEL